MGVRFVAGLCMCGRWGCAFDDGVVRVVGPTGRIRGGATLREEHPDGWISFSESQIRAAVGPG
jgi:hypothetical protein